MNRQLFANGNELDLTGSSVIAVTYQANNIGELQKRQGAYSNTFQVLANDHNAQALGFSHLMTSNTLLPYKKILSTYIQNGIETFSDGEMRIVKVENGYFHLNVVAGNVDLSTAIGDLIVGELFAEDTVYPWTLQNVYDSRDKSKYYIYPVIDWRIDLDTMFSTPTIDVRQLLPCALMTGIFERLEDYTGYTFTGDYIESDEHKNMVLTPSDFSKNPEYYEDEELSAKLVGEVWIGQLLLPAGSGWLNSENIPYYNDLDTDFTINHYYPSQDEKASLHFSMTPYYTLSYTAASGFINIEDQSFYFITRIKNNSGTVLAEHTSEVITAQVTVDTITLEPMEVVNLQTPVIDLFAGEGYFVAIEMKGEGHSDLDTRMRITNKSYEDIIFYRRPIDSLTFGNDIRFRDLFRMSVKDVFYDILNLRGIIIQTNSYTKEVQFNFFNDLIKNKSIAKDWSDKISVESKSLSYEFGNYSQKNNLLFKDNSEVTQDLGNFYFEVNNENLDAEGDSVQIKHPATEQTNKYLGSNIPSIEGIDNLNKWQKPEHRILQMSVQNSSYNVTFDDGTSTLVTDENIPYCKFEGFDILVPKYYEALTDILYNTKAFELFFDLTPIDIQELDFSIPIFLNVPKLDVNGYFYLNSISNYKGGATACQLIRL